MLKLDDCRILHFRVFRIRVEIVVLGLEICSGTSSTSILRANAVSSGSLWGFGIVFALKSVLDGILVASQAIGSSKVTFYRWIRTARQFAGEWSLVLVTMLPRKTDCQQITTHLLKTDRLDLHKCGVAQKQNQFAILNTPFCTTQSPRTVILAVFASSFPAFKVVIGKVVFVTKRRRTIFAWGADLSSVR